MVPRSVQVVDHVVVNSNKSSSNQRFIPYKVLIGKGITLNACHSAELFMRTTQAQGQTFHHDDEKHITRFSETSFDSKYLPIDESNITLKTNLEMFSNKFPASGVVFAVVLVL